MNEYRSVSNFLKKRDLLNKDSKKLLFKVLNRILLSALLFISVLCLIKANPTVKLWVEKNVYNDNLAFATINSMYQKYLGNLFPLDILSGEGTKTVFSQTLKYKDKTKYKDGVKLTVDNNYLMPILESGLVVFVGNKENIGKTIIIQQINGVDLWYVNLKNESVKLYDYVEKGSVLGEVNGNEVFLYYQKKGEFLDYKEYLG